MNKEEARARDKWALPHLKEMGHLGCVKAARKLQEIAEAEGAPFNFKSTFVTNARRRHGLDRVKLKIDIEANNSNISQQWLSKPMR